jgi:hypothetical protein
MMRLLKIAKSGIRNRQSDDDAENLETGEGTAVEAVAEAEGDGLDGDRPEAGPDGASPDALESEIASILAMIRSRKPDDILPEVDLPEETGATYQLLSELDRLWRGAQG